MIRCENADFGGNGNVAPDAQGAAIIKTAALIDDRVITERKTAATIEVRTHENEGVSRDSELHDAPIECQPELVAGKLGDDLITQIKQPIKADALHRIVHKKTDRLIALQNFSLMCGKENCARARVRACAATHSAAASLS